MFSVQAEPGFRRGFSRDTISNPDERRQASKPLLASRERSITSLPLPLLADGDVNAKARLLFGFGKPHQALGMLGFPVGARAKDHRLSE